MTFIINNINSLFYLLLISTQQISDVNFRNFKFQNRSILQEKNASNGESTSQKYDAESNGEINMKKIISLTPCGDFTDWNQLNHSFSFLGLEIYEKLIDTRTRLTSTLNQINLNLRKTSIINMVQEKKLGKNGNSYYYQKSVKKMDIANNIYVSFEQKSELTPIHYNPNESNCDHFELTLFDPDTSFMVRKIVQREFIDSIKRAYYTRKIKKLKKNCCSINDTHPILEVTKMIEPKKSVLKKKVKKVVEEEEPDFRFHFRYELDTIKEINHLLQTYIKLASIENDFLLSFAIIQKRATGELFMHLRTNSGQIYLNNLELFPNRPNNFIFKFKKSNSLTFRIKSLELWSILKYEIYVPKTNCSENLSENKCQNEEKWLIDQLNQRGKKNHFS